MHTYKPITTHTYVHIRDNFLMKYLLWSAGDMAQMVKYLLQKHRDLKSDLLKSYKKLGMTVHLYSQPWGNGNTVGFLLADLLSQTVGSRSNERCCFKKQGWEWRKKTPDNCWSLHIHLKMFICICAHQYIVIVIYITHTHTHSFITQYHGNIF